jgi:hypothetical protein
MADKEAGASRARLKLLPKELEKLAPPHKIHGYAIQESTKRWLSVRMTGFDWNFDGAISV